VINSSEEPEMEISCGNRGLRAEILADEPKIENDERKILLTNWKLKMTSGNFC
jgi:hypothetical protein